MCAKFQLISYLPTQSSPFNLFNLFLISPVNSKAKNSCFGNIKILVPEHTFNEFSFFNYRWYHNPSPQTLGLKEIIFENYFSDIKNKKTKFFIESNTLCDNERRGLWTAIFREIVITLIGFWALSIRIYLT